MMLGYDPTGSFKTFDVSGNFNSSLPASRMVSPTFFCFSRLVVKDEIKKGSFSMVVDTGSWVNASQTFTQTITITDSGSSDVENGLRILKNSSTGENMGILDRFRGKVQCNVKIDNIIRKSNEVSVNLKSGENLKYDKIIFATPPDQILEMLADPTDAEITRE